CGQVSSGVFYGYTIFFRGGVAKRYSERKSEQNRKYKDPKYRFGFAQKLSQPCERQLDQRMRTLISRHLAHYGSRPVARNTVRFPVLRYLIAARRFRCSVSAGLLATD